MLTKAEIDRILNKSKKENTMFESNILKEAAKWDYKDYKVKPTIVACVYSYMNNKYKVGASLDDMVDCLGISALRITSSLNLLEDYGYLTISRSTKPFSYRVIK